MSATWCPADATSSVSRRDATDSAPNPYGEHMERQCTTCGYAWPEAPMDHVDDVNKMVVSEGAGSFAFGGDAARKATDWKLSGGSAEPCEDCGEYIVAPAAVCPACGWMRPEAPMDAEAGLQSGSDPMETAENSR